MIFKVTTELILNYNMKKYELPTKKDDWLAWNINQKASESFLSSLSF